MLDVLCPLITESDSVSNNLLDTILINIVEPSKSTRKNAYLLAKELIVKCSDTLESYIQSVRQNTPSPPIEINVNLFIVFQPSVDSWATKQGISNLWQGLRFDLRAEPHLPDGAACCAAPARVQTEII